MMDFKGFDDTFTQL